MKNPTKARKNPNSLANLKPPFEPKNTHARGHGRPKLSEEERDFRQANTEYLKHLAQSGLYHEYLDKILKVQVKQGRIDLLKYLWESVNGKPPISISGIPNEPIEIRFLDAPTRREK